MNLLMRIPLSILVGGFVAISFVAIFAVVRLEARQELEAFRAWEKFTGNHRKLTFREWRVLRDASRRKPVLIQTIDQSETP